MLKLDDNWIIDTESTINVNHFSPKTNFRNVWNVCFTNLLVSTTPGGYGCSFVAKLSWKKKLFLRKYLCFLQNMHYLQKKMFLNGKKVLYWKICLLKKTFFTEKNVKICISFETCIFIQKMFVLQTKYKSFLNTYSFCKKIFFDHKRKCVRNSLWTQ